MKKFKKLCAILSLAAAMTLGVGLSAQPAQANCLVSYTLINGDGTQESGFVSCGSSAGNYIGRSDGSTVGGDGVNFLCDVFSLMGVC